MEDPAIGLLDAASRCLLAFAGQAGSKIAPMAHWYDGQDVWMAAASEHSRAIAENPACALCVPTSDGVVVARGQARVFGLGDPVLLALHAGPIAGALGVLALRNVGTLLGHARDALLGPAAPPVVVRVRVRSVATISGPIEQPGLAPPLPPAVPADVRRALAGQRLAVVVHGRDRPEITSAVWTDGLALAGPAGRPLEMPGPVVAVMEAGGPDGAAGLALHGLLSAGRLDVVRATWWRGFDVESADVPAAPPRGVVLPD